MTDDLTSFARKYRQEAAAALVTVIRDDTAPASARTAAAERILAYANGRPQAAKQITVVDIGRMTEEERMELFQALLHHYLPEGSLQALLKQSVDEAMLLLPPPGTAKFGFRRGKDAPTPKFGQDDKAGRRNELDSRARRYADSREPLSAHERALKSISLDAELPPPRSPQHSPNGRPLQRMGDGEPKGSNGVDRDYQRLLERYNFRTRNGGNGHGH
jgi:hypothetical protein